MSRRGRLLALTEAADGSKLKSSRKIWPVTLKRAVLQDLRSAVDVREPAERRRRRR
jgi:hypothetical protein